LATPDNAEWGYTNLADLEALYSPGGITPTTDGTTGRVQLRPRLLVECDLSWTPRTVAAVQLPGRAHHA
jgi:hypothetical protein